MTTDHLPTIWRDPAEETNGLYPGLTVCDNRVTGSITLGQSRLPAWALRTDFPDWDDYATDQTKPGGPHHGVSKDDLRWFIHNLLEMRGEFGRLLLILADGERRDANRSLRGRPWWEKKGQRKRVADQLRRCLAVLGEG